jgi:hypothetical protein
MTEPTAREIEPQTFEPHTAEPASTVDLGGQPVSADSVDEQLDGDTADADNDSSDSKHGWGADKVDGDPE